MMSLVAPLALLVAACDDAAGSASSTTPAIIVSTTMGLEAAVAALSDLSADDAGLVVPIQHTAASAHELRALIRSTDGLLAYQVDSLEDCSSTAQIFTEEPPYSLPPAVVTIINDLAVQCETLARSGVGHVITDEERASASAAIDAVEALYQWWSRDSTPAEEK